MDTLLSNAGQMEVLKWWNRASDAEKDVLRPQIEHIDFPKLKASFALTMQAKDEGAPAPLENVVKVADSSAQQLDAWRRRGMEAIAAGQVAVIVLAGGQGTRLGSSAPKGTYDIGMPSHKPLFQFFSERIIRLHSLASKEINNGNPTPPLPLYVMTSPMTHAATVDFFDKNDNFGLARNDVKFFQQGTLPCVDFDGKVMMESATTISCAPDGNGGIYPALYKSGMLSDMRQRGVMYVHCVSVDNAISRIADPVFIGLSIEKNVDCGAKCVAKTGPHEAVGELGKELAEERDANGALKFNAGNICNHFYTVDFLHKIQDIPLPYHIARKKIPCADEDGKPHPPPKENGIKLEMFIFDVFPLAQNFLAFEVVREEEFSPVKNAPGSAVDSPDTARHMMSRRHRELIEKAGGKINDDGTGLVEISPLVSLEGEGLASLVEGKTFSTPLHLQA